MNLVKGYSPVLDCEVWRLQQFAHGRWFLCELFSVFCSYHHADPGGAERNYIAERVRERRTLLRQGIQDFQQEQTSVHA